MSAPEYQFRFQIIDKTTGDIIEADWTYLTTIDQFGNCESVDIHVGAALRGFNRSSRAEYEAKEYPEIEKKRLVAQTAQRIREVAEGR